MRSGMATMGFNWSLTDISTRYLAIEYEVGVQVGQWSFFIFPHTDLSRFLGENVNQCHTFIIDW